MQYFTKVFALALLAGIFLAACGEKKGEQDNNGQENTEEQGNQQANQGATKIDVEVNTGDAEVDKKLQEFIELQNRYLAAYKEHGGNQGVQENEPELFQEIQQMNKEMNEMAKDLSGDVKKKFEDTRREISLQLQQASQ